MESNQVKSRPGKAYFVIGIGVIASCTILGISILMDEEARFEDKCSDVMGYC